MLHMKIIFSHTGHGNSTDKPGQTLPTDGLAFHITRSSAGMLLAVLIPDSIDW